jgi:hypothetical protein
MGVAALSLAVMSRIPFPPLPGQGTTHLQGRPTAEIVRQPVFIIAAAACAIGYGVMNLLMAATPIAMAQCNHPFSAAALVLENDFSTGEFEPATPEVGDGENQ